MSELERITKRVKERVGKECLDVLKESREDGPLEGTIVFDCLTSELIFLTNGDDIFQYELDRRFKLLDLSQQQSLALVQQEKQTLASLERSRDERWAGYFFLIEGIKKETLATPQQLSLSEIVSIIDDANSTSVRDHEWLSSEFWATICQVIGDQKESPYHNELIRRLKEFGFSESQISSFIRNECMILERLKWGYHSNPAWQESTMIC